MGTVRLIVALFACRAGGFELEPVGVHQQQLHECATRLPDKGLLPGNPYTMTIVFAGRRPMARRQKRSRKRQEPAGSGSVLLLMVIAIVVVLAIIFLTVLEVITSGVAAVLAMTLLAAILFLLWLRTSPARGGQRRKRTRKRPAAAAGPPVIQWCLRHACHCLRAPYALRAAGGNTSAILLWSAVATTQIPISKSTRTPC